MGRLDDKQTVIIGGSTGVGLATAQLLIEQGARVLLTGRTPQSLEAAAARLGGRAIAVRSDASSLTEIDALATRIKAEFGSVDALFVNAGIARSEVFEQVSENDFDALFAVNAKGPYFTVQKLAPVLRDGGAVVLTTSVAGARAVPGSVVYGASKAALRAMTRGFARELLPRSIRVNAVSPGPIDTGILDRSMPAAAAEKAKAQMTARNPMQRFGLPREVAKAVLFLAFDATYTTGFELVVDGGVSQL